MHQEPHVNKILRSVIIKRSQLKIKAIKSKSKNVVIEYKKQRNKVIKLNNLETKKNSKPFWSTCKSYFSNKYICKGWCRYSLENNKILLDNRKVAIVFKNYFQSITKNLNLFEWPDEPKFNIFDKIDISINKFRFRSSIVKLKQKFPFKRKFAFKPVTEEFVKNFVNNISRNKAIGGHISLRDAMKAYFCYRHTLF